MAAVACGLSLNASPLHAPAGSRYFLDAQGKAVYLSGWHTWNNFQDLSTFAPIDYPAYLNSLQADGCNFTRLWNWETINIHYISCPPGGWGNVSPHPFERTGPGVAQDGKPRFDLTRYNPVFFERLRERVALASQKGIYTMVMFFEAIGPYSNFAGSPFNAANNVNGGAYRSQDVFTLNDPRMTQIYDNYIRKVVDTLNDFDNVLWEPANEPQVYSADFISHVIDVVHQHEASKPKQHPVIFSSFYSEANQFIHGSANADWIAPGATYSNWDPGLYANPRKPWLMDTDHIFLPSTGGWQYVWKCFLRGYNVAIMDAGPVPCTEQGWNLPDPQLRRACGDTVRFANRMDLIHMTPSTTVSSTAYALFNEGQEYLVWQPRGADPFVVQLAAGVYNLEWFSPSTSASISSGTVTATSGSNTFRPPDGYGAGIVLYLKRSGDAPVPEEPAPNPGNGSGAGGRQLVQNHSFEQGAAGWIFSGNMGIGGAPGHTADGNYMIAFNWGQTDPNGSASQLLTTVPGRRYTLTFDVGAVGWNTREQSLHVQADGAQPLLKQKVDLAALGGGAVHWKKFTYEFVADSETTKLTFSDVSPHTHDLDLWLDNVLVIEGEGTAPVPPVPSVPELTNGGFESGREGWSLSGNVRTAVTRLPFAAYEGAAVAVFNDGDMPPNGVVAQKFQTQPGRTYRLSYQVGVIGYHANEQRMRVELHGTGPLGSRDVAVTATADAVTQWFAQSDTFVANGPETTVIFRDVSSVTHALDMMLDGVNISAVD